MSVGKKKRELRKFKKMRQVSEYGDCPEISGWLIVLIMLSIFLLCLLINIF